ncbi:VOC family protein [Frankia sp. CNm7]|uniref:VOC family protein n=1 Tax=Frankia nepalensis TaxID=1836974 RepID=A0A937RF37_9ACTN|nr:VOC family protein [Frankia nepalensis]MBL7499445.1 VOC family protein [Frankia nepalensis]MBL7511860.1 VOC family protein [Frankia nepalensis]MBL7524364.1 VOC family protein [Frankia nepalensis]MBL7629032.1 VOC family protein [Frankia nepalensis]
MIGKLQTVVLDCRDPLALAQFYGELLGLPVTSVEPDWVTLGDAGTSRVDFQLAPDHVPPSWPDPARPQQFHLDIEVEDLDEAERAVLALGARHLSSEQAPDSFRVYADPAGHPFCLVLPG